MGNGKWESPTGVGQGPMTTKARTARLRGRGAGLRGPRERPCRGVGQSPT